MYGWCPAQRLTEQLEFKIAAIMSKMMAALILEEAFSAKSVKKLFAEFCFWKIWVFMAFGFEVNKE
ncbi:MAG TPA: hypothetical protein VNJ07_06655 [Chitinophagales bacterium]|nr:hypothetical protein [Chitinophagales bacterium]